MFKNLSERLGNTLRNIGGKGRLTEENVKDALRDIRMALLEADVALPVVKQFIEEMKPKALGELVTTSLTPGQVFVKLVNDELTHIMGEKNESLNLTVAPPAVVLLTGLQGSGKTTTTAKLARLLKEKEKRKVLVVSCDIYRPAAIEQLATLAEQIGVNYFPSSTDQKPTDIAKNAIKHAKSIAADVVLIDSAGRLHIDEAMMDEIKAVHAACDPIETLFVVDAMTGQDAANSAKAFNEVLPLTGIILTKTDGDARGGAALSARYITGKPIKFLGTGEKIDALEYFYPERIASRILGMGDIVSLVEEVQDTVDIKQAEKLGKRLKKGKFDLTDFLSQIQQMKNMGGLTNIMGKLPGMSKLPDPSQVDDNHLKQVEAIIYSMTKKERRFPDIIKGSRKRRIAKGSGTEVQDVNRLLKQFTQMQKMMKKMSKGNSL